MKIIHLVLGKANPERMNGVNKVAYQLARTQTDMGHQVQLWGIANTLTPNFPERNFPTTLFRQLKNKLFLDPDLIAAIQQLRRGTIVHIHGAFIPEFYHVSRWLRRQEIEYVYTPHGALTGGALQKNTLVKKLYFQLFEKSLIKNAKVMQLLGIQELAYVNQMLVSDNKRLIPNGQDLAEIPMIPRKRPEHQAIVFGFCGRLATFHKGLDLTLKAFQRYLTRGHQGTLELIGDGVDRPELEALSKSLQIESQVVFHGARFGREKFELIAGFDVFMHTSRMEGFPTAVLEAAAMEKTCITSEATNINDYLRSSDAGLPLMENNVVCIAKTMEKANQLFRAGELPALGKRARKMVAEEFNWTKVAQQLIEVYGE